MVLELDEAVIRRLGRMAEAHAQPLESELRDILEQASESIDETNPIEAAEQAIAIANQIRRSLEGRYFSDSAKMIRATRDA